MNSQSGWPISSRYAGKQLGVANSPKPKPEPSVPEQPQTAEEYSAYLDDFIEENLANFYHRKMSV